MKHRRRRTHTSLTLLCALLGFGSLLLHLYLFWDKFYDGSTDLTRGPPDLVRQLLIIKRHAEFMRGGISVTGHSDHAVERNASLHTVSSPNNRSDNSMQSGNHTKAQNIRRTDGLIATLMLFSNMTGNISGVNHDPLHMTHDWTKAEHSHMIHVDNSYRRRGSFVENYSRCTGGFLGYSNDFALLRDVTVVRKFCDSKRRGGEFIDEVIGQNEKVEFINYTSGCFTLVCPNSSSISTEYTFKRTNHLNDYLRSLELTSSVSDDAVIEEKFTIVITRYEYVNLYHTMTDWYNAFLVMHFFNLTSSQTDILLMDAHPRGILDPVWGALYRRARRLSDLSQTTHFKQMAWSIQGYNSPMLSHNLVSIPLVEEFRNFFISSYGLKAEREPLDCQRMRILFIWRRDYVAHPRKPSGNVNRKIANEQELLQETVSKYPNFIIQGIQIDLFEMRKQLEMILETDILIGMHGAGLTHALFLPTHAALIELFPSYWSVANMHFKAIARWRGLQYLQYQNKNRTLEKDNSFTIIETQILDDLLKQTVTELCLTQ